MEKGRLIIVHGCWTYGWLLGRWAKARCDKVIKIIKEDDILILTGGVVKERQGGISEAAAMRRYLEKKGIKNAILLEDESRTTIENVEIICKRYDFFLEHFNVYCVTSWTNNPSAFRAWFVWRYIARKKVKIIPVFNGLDFRAICIEIAAMAATVLYWLGIKFPENYFRRKFRA